MAKFALKDEAGSFDLTLLKASEPTRVVLFAVGAGGNPERHLPLLTALVEHGCTVVAPHFERWTTPTPINDYLLLRACRLSLALDCVQRPGLPVAGLGHSIGAAMSLALVGGQAWMRAGDPLSIAIDARIYKVALFTPTVDFFRAPNALDAIRIPILAWAGTKDDIIPTEHIEFLKRVINADVDVRVVEGAGHFSFMHVSPPNISDPFPNRDALLADLSRAVCRFIAG